ncbi:MAG: type II secretion system F family protein [Acidobacteriia bacterium]|nr:type II secretion system F family protein [Terriglobia bacterium]
MAILIPLGMFAVLMAAISWVGYRHYARPGRVYDQVGAGETRLELLPSDLYAGSYIEGAAIRMFRIIGEKVPISPEDVNFTRRTLIAAGYRTDGAPWVLYGMKVVFAALLAIVGFYLRTSVAPTVLLQFLFVGIAGAVGFFLPSLILDMKVARRQEMLKFALPDALDLMVICVEAGLGLDQTIVNVAKELRIAHPDMADEMTLITLEMQAGKRRMESLRNMAERTGVNEIRKLVAILIQTDRFGTSMSEALRTHSEFMRIRRRQEAEERASKIGVKLVFPIFFCILPAMLLVVAGPGILQMLKYLFPMMRQFRV